MSTQPAKLRTQLIATPHTGAACLYMMLDVLSSVGRDWAMVTGAAHPVRQFEVQVATLDDRACAGPTASGSTPRPSLARDPAPTS